MIKKFNELFESHDEYPDDIKSMTIYDFLIKLKKVDDDLYEDMEEIIDEYLEILDGEINDQEDEIEN